MHIVFLHNLQTDLSPEQAEFDTPQTVAAIRQALEQLGHKYLKSGYGEYLLDLLKKGYGPRR